MTTDENISDEPIFDATKKKKSKKRTIGAALTEVTVTNTPVENIVCNETNDETTKDPDYTYEYLLSRILVDDGIPPIPSRIRVPILEVARIGTRRTSFVNFALICKALQRQEKQIQDYYMVELGVPSSIDGNHSLILRGRFTRVQIENILRSFIRDYVVCKTCHGIDTFLGKSNRLTVIKCNSCKSEYSVAKIQSGFQAQIGRRVANMA